MAWIGLPRRRSVPASPQALAERAYLRRAVGFTIAFFGFTASRLIAMGAPTAKWWVDVLSWSAPLVYLLLAWTSWEQYAKVRRGEVVVVAAEQPAPGPESPAVWWVMVSLIGIMTLLTAVFTFIAVMLPVLSWQRQAPAPPGLLIVVSALAVLFWVAVIIFWRRIMAERPNKPEE